MSGGGAKGGPQAGTQQAVGGGKGGPQAGINRGPLGNAQNNPGGPQANYGMGMNPGNPGLSQWASMAQMHPGLGSAGVSQMPAQPGPGPTPTPQPNSAYLSNDNGYGMWGGRPAQTDMSQFGDIKKLFAGLGSSGMQPQAFGGGLGMSQGNLTPINQAVPTPQPQSPVGGYIGGQPAQFHYQAQALNQPRATASGLPANGILAKLFGG